MTQDPKYIEEVKALIRQLGVDPVVKGMVRDGDPLTRETYIALNWGPDGMPNHPEAELEIPPYLTNEPLDPAIIKPFME